MTTLNPDSPSDNGTIWERLTVAEQQEEIQRAYDESGGLQGVEINLTELKRRKGQAQPKAKET
jgi:hypothetical protein